MFLDKLTRFAFQHGSKLFLVITILFLIIDGPPDQHSD
jgi:hypothetical protein